MLTNLSDTRRDLPMMFVERWSHRPIIESNG